MALNWINIEDYSFSSCLFLERFQIAMMFHNQRDNGEWLRNMGIALAANPQVTWYMARRCPEHASNIESVMQGGHLDATPEAIRAAEVAIMGSIEDWITYTTPEVMDTSCDFIYAWDKQRLYDLADFTDKVVLDVGSGSGRLAFAAAERASMVYASEPVSKLREYLRDKIAREGILNMRVVDGMAHSLAYPDSTFDIVMSGHVVGDDYDNEIAELTRVTKPGGWLIDCPGATVGTANHSPEAVQQGFEEFHYVSSLGGVVYEYRKQIVK